MRYKQELIGQERLTTNASDDMLLLTSLMSFIIAVVLIYIGRRGKQMYLWVWGIGLLLASVYLYVGVSTGWKPFTYF